MSSFHAGYAATVCVKQKTAQDILHIYYADGDIPAVFNPVFSIPVPGLPTVTVQTNMFMAEPQLLFQPQVNNWPAVSVRMSGTFTFSAAGVPPLTALVVANATLACPVGVTEEATGYRFFINISQGICTAFQAFIADANNPANSFGLNLDDPPVQEIIQAALLNTPNQNFFFTYQPPLLSMMPKSIKPL